MLSYPYPGENQITLDYAQITQGKVSLNNISETTNLIVDFGRHHGTMPGSAMFRKLMRIFDESVLIARHGAV